MIILSWNCQGLGHSEVVPVLHDFLKNYKVDVFVLFEILVGSSRVEEVKQRLGFERGIVVDSVGRSGGLCVLWRKASMCCLLTYARTFIDIKIIDNNEGNWKLTEYCGFPERGRLRDSKTLLKDLSSKYNPPWCCIGDFNCHAPTLAWTKRGGVTRD